MCDVSQESNTQRPGDPLIPAGGRKKGKKFAQPFSEGWHNKEEQGDLKKLEANMPLSLLTNRRLSFVILTSVSVMLRGGFAWLLSL